MLEMLEKPEPVALGVYGIGKHACRTILPAIAVSEKVRLAGIASRDIEVLRAQSDFWKCRAWPSLNEMLRESEVDAVMVSTPIPSHYSDGIAVLKAGKHLWSEKALACTLEESEALVELSRQENLALCLSCPPLYHPQFKVLATLIREGQLGAIRSVSASFAFPLTKDLGSKVNAGGALLDTGFYPLGVPTFLFDEEPVLEGGSAIGQDDNNTDLAGAALLRYPKLGIHHSAIWGYGSDYINEIRIIGETGMVLASPAFSKPSHLPQGLELRRQNITEIIPIDECNQFTKMLEDFALTLTSTDAQERLRKQALKHQRLVGSVQVMCGLSDRIL